MIGENILIFVGALNSYWYPSQKINNLKSGTTYYTGCRIGYSNSELIELRSPPSCFFINFLASSSLKETTHDQTNTAAIQRLMTTTPAIASPSAEVSLSQPWTVTLQEESACSRVEALQTSGIQAPVQVLNLSVTLLK